MPPKKCLYKTAITGYLEQIQVPYHIGGKEDEGIFVSTAFRIKTAILSFVSNRIDPSFPLIQPGFEQPDFLPEISFILW